MSFSAHAAIRKLDKDMRRADFLSRQLMLAAWAVANLALFALLDVWLLVALVMLIVKTGSAEAQRFRKSGSVHQTRRSIWRGSCDEDARARCLLNGWRPWQAR